MERKFVNYTLEDGIATVTIDHPLRIPKREPRRSWKKGRQTSRGNKIDSIKFDGSMDKGHMGIRD